MKNIHIINSKILICPMTLLNNILNNALFDDTVTIDNQRKICSIINEYTCFAITVYFRINHINIDNIIIFSDNNNKPIKHIYNIIYDYIDTAVINIKINNMSLLQSPTLLNAYIKKKCNQYYLEHYT